jgi:hypothetical protein
VVQLAERIQRGARGDLLDVVHGVVAAEQVELRGDALAGKSAERRRR